MALFSAASPAERLRSAGSLAIINAVALKLGIADLKAATAGSDLAVLGREFHGLLP